MTNICYTIGETILFTADHVSNEIVDDIKGILQCKSCDIQKMYKRQLRKEISNDYLINDSLYSLLRLEQMLNSYDDNSFDVNICDSHIYFIKMKYLEFGFATRHLIRRSDALYVATCLKDEYKQYLRKDNKCCKKKYQSDGNMKIKFKPYLGMHVIKHKPIENTNGELKSCLKRKCIEINREKRVLFSEVNYKYDTAVYEIAAKITRQNLENRCETMRRIMEEAGT